MFDFIDRAKDNLILDISIKKANKGQSIFEINSRYASELVYYMSNFMNEWDIKTSASTVSVSELIPDEIFYF